MSATSPRYLYRLSFESFDRGVALCEATEWLNTPVATDFVFSDHCVDITECAYVAQAFELIARAASLDELVVRLRALQLPYKGFAIESAHTIDAAFESAVKKMGSMQIAKFIADAMPGQPNLRAPVDSLWALKLPDEWIFGRRIGRYSQSWTAHLHKPHSYSSSVNPRHARALVNIAAPSRLAPRTFVDPCAGAGTVLIEAATRGLEIFGVEIGPRILPAAQGNLAHFGFPPDVVLADAATLPAILQARATAAGIPVAPFDAAVIDFPYGHFSPAEQGLYERILAAIHACVRRIVILTPTPADALLAAHGYRVLNACTAQKSRLVRHITVAEAKP